MAIQSVSDLDTCVKQIICGLSRATLNALSALLDGYIATATVELQVIEAQLLQYDVLSVVPTAANAAAQEALAAARSALFLVPTSLSGPCVQFSIVTKALEEVVNTASADVEIISRRLSRLLSYKDELELVKAELVALLNVLNTIKAQINLC